MSIVKWAGGVSLGTLICATGAFAQAVPDYTGDTTSGPTFDRPRDPSECCYRAPTVAYEVVQITIDTPPSFVARMERVSADYDTFLYLYMGDFTPGSPAGFAAANDDFPTTSISQISARADGPFTEGQYTLVATGWVANDFGVYDLFLTGATLGWGPSVSEQLDEVQAAFSQNGRQILRFGSTNVDGAISDSFASRDAPTVTRGPIARPRGGAYVWLEGQYSYAEGNGRSAQAPLAQIGADFALRDNLIVGAAVSHGDISVSAPGFSLDGTQTIVQPYIGWQSSDWSVSGSVSFGEVKYGRITSGAGTAAAEGKLLGIHGRVSRSFALNETQSISPFISANAARIKLDATSGTLAGVGLSSDVEYHELRLGGVMAEVLDNGMFSIGLSADYFNSNAPVALSSGSFDEEGWSGTVELDYQRRLKSGFDLTAGLSASGLGGDVTLLQGTLGLGMSF